MDDVGDEYDRHTEGGVEILEAEPKCMEDTLRGEISKIADEVGCPEGSC